MHSDPPDAGSVDGGSDSTDAGPVDPGSIDPGSIDPGSIDPGSANRISADAGSVDPRSADAGPVHPGSIDPGSADPGFVDPGFVDPGFVDLGFARVDTDRAARTGDPEVVYGAGKSTQQVIDIVATLRTAHPDRAILATRIDEPTQRAIEQQYGVEARLDPLARAAAIGPLPAAAGTVCVVSAGTSDGPVAAEAAFTAAVYGSRTVRLTDVGVAGIHRVLSARDTLESADCLIVVAGMDGALPSVVGGLTGVPLVAVPTSVGYGASFGGIAALLTMLNSCAPGVVVSNIDNGFGAGVFAARVARRAAGGDRE